MALLAAVVIATPFCNVDWASAKPAPRAASDQVYNNLSLLTSPAPFAQLDWPKARAVATAPAAPLAYNVNIFSEVPFYKSDWASASRIILSTPPTPPNVVVVLIPVVAAVPFIPLDWSRQANIPDWLPPPPPSLNLNLYKNPIPFVSTDRPMAWRVPLAPPPQSLPNNIRLLTNPTPFVQTDWPTTTFVRRQPQHTQPYNLSLLTVTVTAAPFNQADWARPFTVRSLPPAPATLNVNLFTNPIPFGPFDWSKPLAVSLVPVAPLPINLSLSTVVVQSPLVPIDWSVSVRAKSAAVDQLIRNPLIFSEVPFAQFDWPKTALDIPLQVLPQPLNINLFGIVAVSAPFYQTAWPAASPPRVAPPSPLPLNVNLLTNPIPFAQLDWSTLARPQWRLWDQPTPNMALLTAVFTPMPFSQYNWPPAAMARPSQSPDIPNFQILVAVGPSAPAELHNHPFFATVGQLMGGM